MKLRAFKLLYQAWWAGKYPTIPYNHIVQIGDPVLRLKAKAVDPSAIQEEPMKKLIARLCRLMKDSNTLSLSAPQVGVSLRVFAIQSPPRNKFKPVNLYDARKMEHIPFQVWINPEMKILDYRKYIDEESCESMKCFTADTSRYTKVLLTGLDHEGKEKAWEASGWSARIVQHEMDHLNGKFFIDIMEPHSLACSHWQVINHKQGKIFVTYLPKK
ncbi:peptide deformylase, mitochondrial-like [Cimex lectularius]|uniref:Peptide deformylase n=1 Tax=Cimex lectularius TaxID=79782 RepID=A0A8I6S8P2_CIMLE|nr:peptide deformylase, mitochondrial-like [Cimex lectularius]XP_014259533.1 peptide deformylase, mitochondrial-like [Cimex lectularius]